MLEDRCVGGADLVVYFGEGPADDALTEEDVSAYEGSESAAFAGGGRKIEIWRGRADRDSIEIGGGCGLRRCDRSQSS